MKRLNLIVGYECPLKCKYCGQRDSIEHQGQLTLEELDNTISSFIDYAGESVHIDFSGGEPLLRWEDVKYLIAKYPNNKYDISTSGVLLTTDKLEFLSQYPVSFILSVDGGEKITNYLRPMVNGGSYFKKLKENMPSLLYYFPNVRAKLIVSKRLIPNLFDTYLELEQIGFRCIFITPNVYENTINDDHPELSTGRWEERDWMLYSEQMRKISNEIIKGLEINKYRCRVSNFDLIIQRRMFPTDKLDFNKMICEALDLRIGVTPEIKNINLITSCLKDTCSATTQEELQQKAYQEFPKLDAKCPKNPDCLFYQDCVLSTCIEQNARETGNFFIPSEFQCQTQKIHCQEATTLMEALYSIKNYEAWNYLNAIYEGGIEHACS